MIRIYSCHTPSHEILYRDYFLRSLPRSLESHDTSVDIGGTGDFLSEEFLRSIEVKLRLQLESIQANAGSAIVWSDVDIVFTTDPVPTMMELLDSRPDIDIWFQKETVTRNDDVNAGFVLMRCNAAVESLYAAALAAMQGRSESNDQAAINHLLRTQKLASWTYLPLKFYARTHGWPPKDDIVLYHANRTAGADGVGQKIRQFADLRGIRRYGRPYLHYVRYRERARKVLAMVAGR